MAKRRDVPSIHGHDAAASDSGDSPEADALAPLDHVDKENGAPSCKSVPVRVTRAQARRPAAK